MYEVRIVDELRVELEQLVHLLLGEVFVNDMRAKTPGVLVSQILEDESRQVGQVGPAQAAEQVPQADLVQLSRFQTGKSTILHALKVVPIGERDHFHGLETDPILAEFGGVGGFASFHDPAVVEAKVELAPEVFHGALRILSVTEHGHAVLDFLAPWIAPISLEPKLEEVVDFLEILPGQGMEGGVVVIFLSPGDQFLKSF